MDAWEDFVAAEDLELEEEEEFRDYLIARRGEQPEDMTIDELLREWRSYNGE